MKKSADDSTETGGIICAFVPLLSFSTSSSLAGLVNVSSANLSKRTVRECDAKMRSKKPRQTWLPSPTVCQFPVFYQTALFFTLPTGESVHPRKSDHRDPDGQEAAVAKAYEASFILPSA